jgi:hypothetical protein
MRIAIVIILVASTAHADRRKYTRPSPPPPVALTSRVLPRHAPAEPQPAVTADDILAAVEGNQPIRREQEELLVKLARETPDGDPEKPDIMFRLAELYAKQLRFWRLKATEATFTHE